jgi:hypothetical protein
MLVGALVLVVGDAMAADPPNPAPLPSDAPIATGWAGRLSLGANASPWTSAVEPPASRLFGPTLMGDYYFGPPLSAAGLSGGLRATSGVILSSHGALGPQTSLTLADPFATNARALGTRVVPLSSDAGTDTATLPYFGLGYTGLSARSGWAFSADLGLAAQSAGAAVRFGHGLSGTPALDDAVHDMRLAPIVQFAVSYSF